MRRSADLDSTAIPIFHGALLCRLTSSLYNPASRWSWVHEFAAATWTHRPQSREWVLKGAVEEQAVIGRIGSEANRHGKADHQLGLVRQIEGAARTGRNQRRCSAIDVFPFVNV